MTELKQCPFCKSFIEMEPYMNGKDLVHKVHIGRPRKCRTISIISNRKYRSKVTEVKTHWNKRMKMKCPFTDEYIRCECADSCECACDWLVDNDLVKGEEE